MNGRNCTLCRSPLHAVWQMVDASTFFRCSECDLIQRPPCERPDLAAERAHYGYHQNDPADPGYRAFLDRCLAPLVAQLPTGSRGIDFGCGPGPTVSVMAAERGLEVTDWDPAFSPDPAALERTYDFLIATEVLEHLHDPGATLARMNRLVRPGGWIAVMTRIYDDARDWSSWNYWRDPTHVCIYTCRTMDWIARKFGYAAESPHPDVRLWRNPNE